MSGRWVHRIMNDLTKQMKLSELIAGKTVILEKDILHCESLREQLQLAGLTDICATDNIDTWQQELNQHELGMVICNIDIHTVSILNTLKDLRRSGKHRRLLFLTLTAGTDKDIIAAFIKAKVTDIILTPLKTELLQSRIYRAASTHASHPDTTPYLDIGKLNRFTENDLIASTQDSPTILVVDDIPDNLLLITSVFRKEFHLKLVKEGEKAIRICQSDNPPDLVLLDIMMPNLSGFDVARILREHPVSEHIPIVFMTALDDSYSRRRAMKLGAVDFITKPIDIELLRFRIANLMRLVHARRHLQKEYDQMLELNRLKESLEFNVRYEIKEPLLNALHHLDELSAHTPLNLTQKTQLATSRRSIVDALELTRLASEIYKIETGTFSLKIDMVKLFDIFNRLSVQYKERYSDKQIDIKLTKPHNYLYDELSISGDSFLCYSAFQILLRLICEYTMDKGVIHVVCMKNSADVAISITSTTTLDMTTLIKLQDKFTYGDSKEYAGANLYHARMLMEAQAAAMTMTLDESSSQLTIATIFSQKEEATPYTTA
jgi:two-component system sensor histidine kinase/response regulator